MKDDSSFWVEESTNQFCLPMKRKRKVRSKKLEFIGWGSKPLIEFLESIGKDTSKQLNRYEVTAIVNEYVNAKTLANPAKKKRIICDEWLLSLFGKKSVPRIKIYDLLEIHFAENHNSSEDDSENSSEEQDCGATKLQAKASSLEGKPSSQKKKVSENLRSCFAAVCSENIKLVYLRRTLVQDLSKAPESFEDKVIGSFVRIKSSPYDYLQKNSHLLQQVVGVRMIGEAGNGGKEIQLQLSNCMNETPIQMLSDDNFLEAECEDLLERVNAGLLKRPNFVEFEAKARLLHQDIMKHWILRELKLLQNLIDRAKEKGWRREYLEYFDRRQQLEKSSEQERLIAEIPKVIADELKPETMPLDTFQMGGGMGEGDSASPRSWNWEACDNYYSDDGGSGDVGITSAIIRSNSVVPEMENTGSITGVASKETVNDCQNSKTIENGVAAEENGGEISTEIQAAELKGNEGSLGKSGREVTPAPFIDLSDDDDDQPKGVKMEECSAVENPDDCVWQYMDPRGVVQGSFPLTKLRLWYDANYFDPEFMVWKTGESPDQAVLLVDALRRAFPSC